MKEPGYTSFDCMIIRQSPTSPHFNNRTFFLHLSSPGYVSCQGRDNGTAQYLLTSSSEYDDNEWHHVAVVVDGTTSSELFIDNVSVDTYTPSGASWAGTGVVDIGYISTQGGFGWAGELEDIRIYDRALSDNEVNSIYSLKGRDRVINGLVARITMSEDAPGVTMASSTNYVKDLSRTEDGDASGSTRPSHTESYLSKLR